MDSGKKGGGQRMKVTVYETTRTGKIPETNDVPLQECSQESQWVELCVAVGNPGVGVAPVQPADQMGVCAVHDPSKATNSPKDPRVSVLKRNQQNKNQSHKYLPSIGNDKQSYRNRKVLIFVMIIRNEESKHTDTHTRTKFGFNFLFFLSFPVFSSEKKKFFYLDGEVM